MGKGIDLMFKSKDLPEVKPVKIVNPMTDGEEDLRMHVEEDIVDTDSTATRIIEYRGRKFKAHSTDPYGLWHITWTHGELPRALMGEYTSPIELEVAIKAYMDAQSTKG